MIKTQASKKNTKPFLLSKGSYLIPLIDFCCGIICISKLHQKKIPDELNHRQSILIPIYGPQSAVTEVKHHQTMDQRTSPGNGCKGMTGVKQGGHPLMST